MINAMQQLLSQNPTPRLQILRPRLPRIHPPSSPLPNQHHQNQPRRKTKHPRKRLRRRHSRLLPRPRLKLQPLAPPPNHHALHRKTRNLQYRPSRKTPNPPSLPSPPNPQQQIPLNGQNLRKNRPKRRPLPQ